MNIPDVQRAVVHYLLDLQEVTDFVDRRIVTKPPAETDTAWIQVSWLAAPNDPELPVDYLTRNLVQLDCYAGPSRYDPMAKEIAAAVRAALDVMPEETFEGVEITSVRCVGWLIASDTNLEPARDRVIVTEEIIAHALEPVS